MPDQPFEFSLLDESLTQLYNKEVRLCKFIIAFTSLAVAISCLGLFGLVFFTAEARVKEIGIRKVLGATVLSIFTLLTRDFLGTVGLSFLLSLPIVWYGVWQWLEGFTYRVQIEWWMFALVGMLAGLVVLLTVSYQFIKTALSNPVSLLRNE